MSKKICKECASFDGTCCQSVFAFPYEIECSDDHCEYFAEKPKQTVFDRITASPEVLAEKLVCHGVTSWEDEYYWSTVCNGIFKTRAETIAATVAKLKEVCND